MELTDRHAERSSSIEHSNTYYSVIIARNVIKILSDAAIPIMIGIITLVIAIHQQNVAQLNRDKDAVQATEFRKQDIELARLQREEDRETARKQREEDRDTARKQREEDKEIARLQRELDVNLASNQRSQEYELAERQRNLSERQRIYEFHTAHQNYKDDLILEDDRQKESALLEYQDDLGAMILNYSDTFDDPDNPFWFTTKMKTGAVLRRLDPARRTILIHTLLEAGFFNFDIHREQSVLETANVSGVDFGYSANPHSHSSYNIYNYLRIESADITHATFKKVLFYNSPVFNYSNLDYTHWSFVELPNMRFEGHMTMYRAIFSNCTLFGTIFGRYTKLDQISFRHSAQCIHCQFVRSSMMGARLNNSNFIQSTFSSLSMADSNMTDGSFIASTFEDASLDRVDLSRANLKNCKFLRVSIMNCSMFGTILKNVNFTNVNLTGCSGLTDSQIFSNVIFYHTILPNGTFIERAILKPK